MVPESKSTRPEAMMDRRTTPKAIPAAMFQRSGAWDRKAPMASSTTAPTVEPMIHQA
jgi:hypothetical protein